MTNTSEGKPPERFSIRDTPLGRSMMGAADRVALSPRVKSKSEAAVEAVAEYMAQREGTTCFDDIRTHNGSAQRYEYQRLAAALLAGELWAFERVSGKGPLDIGAECEEQLAHVGLTMAQAAASYKPLERINFEPMVSAFQRMADAYSDDDTNR